LSKIQNPAEKQRQPPGCNLQQHNDLHTKNEEQSKHVKERPMKQKKKEGMRE
jgi:hypothetical protein